MPPGSYPRFSDDATLGEVRAWLREQASGEGARCPCCTQMTKVYRRRLNANMVRLLVLVYRDYGQEWTHASTTRDGTGDLAKLRYWGLLEEEPTRRPDGGRAGWWRVTDRGVAFLRRGEHVPGYALVFDGHLLRHDGEQVTARDALGARFDLAELLGDGGGVAPDLTHQPERTHP